MDPNNEIDKGFGYFGEVSMPPFVDEVDEPTIAMSEDLDDDSDSSEEEEVCSYISKNA